MYFNGRVCGQIFRFRRKIILARSFCKDPKDKTAAPNEGNQIKEKVNNEADETMKTNAKKRLLSLLNDMTTTDTKMDATLAKPHPSTRVRKKECPPKKESNVSEEVLTAIKSVAATATVGAEKIEQELLDRIQTMGNLEQEDIDEIDEDNVEKSAVDDLSEQTSYMMSTVKEIAEEVHIPPPGSLDSEVTPQSELTKKLLSLSSEFKSSTTTGTTSIEKLFDGMKVDNTDAKKDHPVTSTSRYRTRSRRDDHASKTTAHRQQAMQDLFSGPALNIFTVEKAKETESKDVFWNQLEEKSLQSLIQFAPANGFEEMMTWTKQGRHWKFPIDNECEMGAEENVGFHEHLFLEKHLDGFPSKGPIRQFMELVCVGLSKNPYVSVERKIKNIDWYRQYFLEKEDILREYNVLDDK